MKYELIKSSINDLDRLVEYKKNIIYEYAHDLGRDEIEEIEKYVLESVPKLLNDYYNIVVKNRVVGALLVTNRKGAKELDEIYLEEEYRNKGIGTSIIKDIIHNNLVYLWVYKDNLKAISLYQKLGFKIVDETNTRYYMKYESGVNV